MKRLKLTYILNISLLCWLTLGTSSCIDEIERGAFTFDRLLVVDANISDQAKVHEFRLFFTSPVDANINTEPLTLASVWIEDDQGIRTEFTEQDAGSYLSPTNFAGTVGRSYALFINTSDGKRYQSNYEKLVEAPEIGPIYNRFAFNQKDKQSEPVAGVQFFIDADNADQSTQFYRYEWTDTHQVITPYIKKWDYVFYEDGSDDIIPFDEDVSECYREDKFKELILATSTINVNGLLREVPIKFTRAADFNVTTKYSIEVTQRAISPEAYSYYRKIELFNEAKGTLFDKQQGTIIGNIVSVDSPDEKVLGYFEVAGAKSKRIFMDLSDLDPETHNYIKRVCEESKTYLYARSVRDFYEVNESDDDEYRGKEQAIRSKYELYDYFSGGLKAFAHRLCVDCRYSGKVGKPDYWP